MEKIDFTKDSFYYFFEETEEKIFIDEIENEKMDKALKEKLYKNYILKLEEKFLLNETIIIEEKKEKFEKLENDNYYFTENFVGGITCYLGGKPKFIFKIPRKAIKEISINENPIEKFSRNKDCIGFVVEGNGVKHQLIFHMNRKHEVLDYFKSINEKIKIFEETPYTFNRWW